MDQMTIFDFVKPESIALDDMTDEDLRMEMSNATGLDFRPDSKMDRIFTNTYYIAKKGKAVFDTHFSNYSMNGNHARFISVGYSIGYGGGGAPCDSLEDAVRMMKRYMEEAERSRK